VEREAWSDVNRQTQIWTVGLGVSVASRLCFCQSSAYS
jgi:hypothetical protein